MDQGLYLRCNDPAWNAYQCDISEALVIETAQLMKKLGLQAAGYNYVNLDDCWSLKNRSSSGALVAGAL
jgi:alpha-galactosidase